MLKEHLEFFTPDLSSGWEIPAGYPNGLEQKILSGYLDETQKSGSRTPVRDPTSHDRTRARKIALCVRMRRVAKDGPGRGDFAERAASAIRPPPTSREPLPRGG